MTAGHDPDADAFRQAQASSAEMYLRLLVEAELRRAVEYPRLEPSGPGSAPRPVPEAAEGMDRVRAAAEALTAIGAIEDATAHSVLTGFTSALAVRSRVPPLNQIPISWWARDSAGRWHVARQVWSGQHQNGAVLDITLIPPLHPAATSLEIIVTGPSERATATVPILRQATR